MNNKEMIEHVSKMSFTEIMEFAQDFVDDALDASYAEPEKLKYFLEEVLHKIDLSFHEPDLIDEDDIVDINVVWPDDGQEIILDDEIIYNDDLKELFGDDIEYRTVDRYDDFSE